MLFDSHAHINDERFDEDRDGLISEIKNSDTKFFVEIGTDIASSYDAVSLAEKYDFIYAVAGIYPHCCHLTDDNTLTELEKICAHKKVVAIGEIGLDYHWDDVPKDIQKKWFHLQLDLAEKLNMPVSIHSRDAMGDTIDILKEHKNVSGIIHCFSGSAESAKILLNLGYYISFAGPVTFKNAKGLVEAASMVPLSRLLIETDSPYLTPEPYRGQRNNPMNVKEVAKKIAEIKGVSYEEIAKVTMENAKRVYGIK